MKHWSAKIGETASLKFSYIHLNHSFIIHLNYEREDRFFLRQAIR